MRENIKASYEEIMSLIKQYRRLAMKDPLRSLGNFINSKLIPTDLIYQVKIPKEGQVYTNGVLEVHADTSTQYLAETNVVGMADIDFYWYIDIDHGFLAAAYKIYQVTLFYRVVSNNGLAVGTVNVYAPNATNYDTYDVLIGSQVPSSVNVGNRSVTVSVDYTLTNELNRRILINWDAVRQDNASEIRITHAAIYMKKVLDMEL